MDIKNSKEYRNEYFVKKSWDGNNRYKYEEEGILNKCMPKFLFNGNSIFVTFLQLIDLRLIMLFKYIDRIKYFKSITRYK
jgi:hypothetical protein